MAARLTQTQSDTPNCSQQPELNVQLNAYMDSLKTSRSNSSPAVHYLRWCNKLAAFALDLLSAPASQAFKHTKDLFCVWLADTTAMQSYEQVIRNACVTETEQQIACRYWIQILITTCPLYTSRICISLQLLTVNVCTVCARLSLSKKHIGWGQRGSDY